MDKFWLDHYPSNVPHEIAVNSSENINQLFIEACQKYSTKKALTTHGVSLSFATMKKLVDNLSASLQNMGIGKGDRVAIMLPNTNQYPIAVFAILQIGAVVVNVNPLYTSDEVDFLIEDAEPKAIIVLDMFADRLNTIKQKRTNLQVIVSSVGDTYSFVKATFIQLVLKYIKKEIKPLTFTHLKLADLFKAENKLIPVSVVASDMAFLQYTGATTGRPKGAVLTHSNIVANTKQIFSWLEPQLNGLDNHVVIVALPLYHIFSLTANLFTFILNGNECVMIINARDIDGLVKTLKTTPFTVFNSLDTLYNKLLNHKEFMAGSYPQFKYSVSGGMAIREDVARKWFDKTGVMPSNCYGLTETSPAATMSKFDNVFTGACGYPISSTIVEIRDIDTNLPVKSGENGVIWIKGPQVMSGYWKNPEKTAEVLKDGYFNTADIGYLDEEGRLHINSRVSEMIIVSGFNVYPAEVERVINALPQVKESAVVGGPDANTGEKVWAFVVLHEGTLISEQEIKQYCHDHLAGYKVPRAIRIIEELPKSNVGKILRKDLVSTYITIK